MCPLSLFGEKNMISHWEEGGQEFRKNPFHFWLQVCIQLCIETLVLCSPFSYQSFSMLCHSSTQYGKIHLLNSCDTSDREWVLREAVFVSKCECVVARVWLDFIHLTSSFFLTSGLAQKPSFCPDNEDSAMQKLQLCCLETFHKLGARNLA